MSISVKQPRQPQHWAAYGRTPLGTGVALLVGGGIFSIAAGSVGASSNSAVLATGSGEVANSWIHYALTRSGTTLRGQAV